MRFYFHVFLSLTLRIFDRKKRHFSKGAFSDSYKAKNQICLVETTFKCSICWLLFCKPFGEACIKVMQHKARCSKGTLRGM